MDILNNILTTEQTSTQITNTHTSMARYKKYGKPGSGKRINPPIRANSSISHKRISQASRGVDNSHHVFTRSVKNPSHFGGSLPAFFQKNFGTRCQHVQDNTTKGLRTMHKTYYPTQDRMIIIGDIHGDLDKLYECLLLAKVIQPGVQLPKIGQRTNQVMFEFFNTLKWTGGNTFVIQLGDQVDRIRPTNWDSNSIPRGTTPEDEGSSLHIFYLIWHLNQIARQAGGRVICVMGNHEFMNVEGDFRYVSPYEFNEYHEAFGKFYIGGPESEDPDLIAKINGDIQQMPHTPPAGYRERRLAWHPRGIIANFMALNYKTLLQVGKWIFTHAGLTMHVARGSSICMINNSISKYLLLDSPHGTGANNQEQEQCRKMFNRYINCPSEKSPVWNRDFGEDTESERESRLLSGKYDILMKEYNRTNAQYHTKYGIPSAEYLAVGHTPQFYNNKGINGTLDGRVWRCDVGMSRAFGKVDSGERRPQVLEVLRDDVVNVLQG
jgi:hypothetical protein